MQKTKNRIFLVVIIVFIIALCVGGFILFTKARAGRAAANNRGNSRVESVVSGYTETGN